MKKSIVHNYIYETYNERGVKAFEKRVNKFLKEKGITGLFICLNAYKERASGYGQYKDVIEFQLKGNGHLFKFHNTSAPDWDEFEGTSKEKRNLFETILYSKDRIIEDLKEEEK